MSTSVDGPSGPVDLVFGERLSDQGDQKLNVATIQTKVLDSHSPTIGWLPPPCLLPGNLQLAAPS